MELYQQSDNELQPVKQEPFKLEKPMQVLIEKNLEELFNLTFVASEFTLRTNRNLRIDTLAFDEESNSFVIIEYKRSQSGSVVDQGLEYLSAVLNNFPACILKLQKKRNQMIDEKDIDKSSTRVMFVAPEFTQAQLGSVNFTNIPIELWSINRYADGLISLHNHIATSKESLPGLGAASNNQKATGRSNNVLAGLQLQSEDDLLSLTSDEAKERWFAIREKLEDLPGTIITTTAYAKYIVLKRTNNKAVCYFNIRKTAIEVDMHGGFIDKPETVYELVDPRKIAQRREERDRIYFHSFELIDDVDYVFSLIKQRYDNM